MSGWKLRNITFLAVNDKVALFVACGYGVGYTVAIWVFGQDCGNKSVGTGVLGNKCSISAKIQNELGYSENQKK